MDQLCIKYPLYSYRIKCEITTSLIFIIFFYIVFDIFIGGKTKSQLVGSSKQILGKFEVLTNNSNYCLLQSLPRFSTGNSNSILVNIEISLYFNI